jgi:hypothetical protein
MFVAMVVVMVLVLAFVETIGTLVQKLEESLTLTYYY